MEDKVELKVVGLSKGLVQAHAYVLLLEEVDGNRRLPVIVGASEAQSIALALKGLHPPRPFTHDLFVSLCHTCSIRLDYVYIYKVLDGVFYAYIYFTADGVQHFLDSRTSDAVALALRFRVPVYTSAQIVASECVDWKDGVAVSVPITAITMEKLKETLQQAVEEENYELASLVRDEISRRKQGELAPDDDVINL